MIVRFVIISFSTDSAYKEVANNSNAGTPDGPGTPVSSTRASNENKPDDLGLRPRGDSVDSQTTSNKKCSTLALCSQCAVLCRVGFDCCCLPSFGSGFLVLALGLVDFNLR